MRATKLVITIKHLSYTERLKALQLSTLKIADSGATWLKYTKYLQAAIILI